MLPPNLKLDLFGRISVKTMRHVTSIPPKDGLAHAGRVVVSVQRCDPRLRERRRGSGMA